MKELIILTVVYFIGLLLFLLTGMIEINIQFYIALTLGIIGCILIILKREQLSRKE